MLGIRLIGLDNPGCREQIKKLLVSVEMDGCTADPVAHVTGVKLGRRSLKFMDYEIMAVPLSTWKRDSLLGCFPRKIPGIGVPACRLYHPTTVLDLILPWQQPGGHIGKKELAFLGHWNLCRDCPECIYLHCPFGKGM